MKEYPSESDYRVIVEEELGRDTMQRFLRGEKHFLVHTHTTSRVANVSRRVLFGYNETETLRKDALKYEKKKKSTAFTITSEASLDDLEADLHDAQIDGELFHDNKELCVEGTRRTEEGLEVEVGYVHKRATQRRLLNADPKTTSVFIVETEDDSVRTVKQDYEKIDEFNAVKDFFEGWNRSRKAEDQDPVEKIDITLDRLSLEDRVELFNDILGYEPGAWRLEDVLRIGIEQGEDLEEVLGEYDDEDELEELLDEHLRGITNAVLTGEGLRSNRFVQTCVDNGYYFKSGKLLFANTDVARQVEILIEFKSSPKDNFDITLAQEYRTAGDGTLERTSFDEDLREDIRDEFRDVVVSLYSDYLPEAPPVDHQSRFKPGDITDIEGVGPSTTEALEDAGFATIDDLRSAEPDDLLEVDGIGEQLAARLTESET